MGMATSSKVIFGGCHHVVDDVIDFVESIWRSSRSCATPENQADVLALSKPKTKK